MAKGLEVRKRLLLVNKPGFPALPGGRGIIETFYNTFSKHTNVFSECNYFEQIPKNSCQQLHNIGCQGLGAAFSNTSLILNLHEGGIKMYL